MRDGIYAAKAKSSVIGDDYASVVGMVVCDVVVYGEFQTKPYKINCKDTELPINKSVFVSTNFKTTLLVPSEMF